MKFTRIALALNELGWRSGAYERSRVVFACRQTQQLYWAAIAGAVLRPVWERRRFTVSRPTGLVGTRPDATMAIVDEENAQCP